MSGHLLGRSLVGLAIPFPVPGSGRPLAELYLDVDHGRRWLRHYALNASDPALRTAARSLYELYGDAEPLPPAELEDDLLGLASLAARDVEDGRA